MKKAFSAVAGVPWAMEPNWLRIVAEIAQRNLNAPEVVKAREGRPMRGARKAEMRGDVAVIPVTGPIFPRANMMTEMSGATSLEELSIDFHKAMEDPGVSAILLDIDSPGGVVSGVNEFAQQVRSTRGEKPIVAYTAGLAASAAYWIATAADRIVTDPSGMLGSIGVVQMVSVQEKPGSDGYRDFEIVSSNAKNKRPDPSTDEGLAEIKRTLDGLEAVFVGAVARNRGRSEQDVMQNFGAGGVMVGAEAVRAGMADSIGSFEDIIAELSAGSAGISANNAAAAATTETISMTEKSNPAPAPTPAPVVTTESVAKDHPAIAEHFRAEGRTAEQARLADLRANSLPGYEALLAECEADGKSTGADLSRKIVAAQRAKGTQSLADRRTAEAAVLATGAVAPAASATGQPPAAPPAEDLPIEERCKQEWDRDAKLRAEFGELKRYTAFRKAEANGQVKILRRA